MKYPAIVKLVLEKGAENVPVPEQLRFQSFSEAASLLFKERRYEEAAKAYLMAGNTHDLNTAAQWLYQQMLFREASFFYRYAIDHEKAELCAMECLNQGHKAEALAIFLHTKNEKMVHFIKENF